MSYNGLTGKSAIVTGGARGIGKAYALRLVREGVKVVIADILSNEGEKVEQEIKRAGGEAAFISTDLAQENQIQDLVDKTVKNFSRLDILINNAAIVHSAISAPTPLDKIRTEDWDKIMAVNVRGAFLSAKYSYPYMKKAGWGKIVNIASTTFLTGGTADLTSSTLIYVTSKGAIVGLTRALARELGQYRITVNTLMPGLVRTEIFENEEADQYKLMVGPTLQQRSIKRDLVPEDLANAMLFLVSKESDAVSGQTLVVDGGRMML